MSLFQMMVEFAKKKKIAVFTEEQCGVCGCNPPPQLGPVAHIKPITHTSF